MKAYEETMTALSRRIAEFSARHRYHYHCLLAAKAFVERDYQEAIKFYKVAEDLDKGKKWTEVRFYFGMGMSLSDRGYATRAIGYLRQAKYLATWSRRYNGKPNSRFDVYIDGYLAYNLSKIGKSNEALELLEKRLSIEKKKKSNNGIGYTYFSFGKVYKRIENYNKAISNYDKALKYLVEDKIRYVACVYQKSASLIANGDVHEAIECAQKGLSITSDKLWETFLSALVHSALMHNDYNSVTSLKENIIPKLQEYGQYEAAVYYYEQLSNFYYEYGEVDVAFRYGKFTLETQKQLHVELVERGV